MKNAVAALPKTVKKVFARADSGFYCWEVVEAYEKLGCQFIVVARKTARLVGQLKEAPWEPSPETDANQHCECSYQPDGWGKARRFLARRYEKKPKALEAGQPEQYQLFETADYTCRVFVTNKDGPLDTMVCFYNRRDGAGNPVQEANNDAGLKAYPSNNWMMNAIHFQMAMLACNLNCWLMPFNREDTETAGTLSYTTLAAARSRFLFLAAKIWRHGGQVGVRYSDHYEERGIFQRLMGRLRAVAYADGGFAPVVVGALPR